MENETNNDEQRLIKSIFGNHYPPDDRDIDSMRLLDLMEELSEEHCCAGWATWCELDLWEAASSDEETGFPWGQGVIALATCRKLKHLAESSGGWWIHGATSRQYYKDKEQGRVFVPLADWKTLYEKLRPRVCLLSPEEFAKVIADKFREMRNRDKSGSEAHRDVSKPDANGSK